MDCNYIALKYYRHAVELKEIYELVKNGVVVHIFTNQDQNEVLDVISGYNQCLKDAKELRFVNVYRTDYMLQDDEIIALDNKILNAEFYEKVCKLREVGFNYQQYEIITAEKNNNYIVIAGAGTGKTTTMINRLIYLRKTDYSFDFSKVILITFTNKASISMRNKLLSTLDDYFTVTRDNFYLNVMDETSSAIISTIHGFAKKLINDNGENININKMAEIKSFKYQRQRAITSGLDYLYKEHTELYKVIKYYPLYQVNRRLVEIWEKLDNYSIDLNNPDCKVDFGEDEKKFSEILKIVLVKAQQYLDNNKDYEFEIADLMKKLAYKDLLIKVKNDYDLIMVDEFQDSDNVQIEFIAKFSNITGAKLFVVGDEKQSIYRFRGAEHTAFVKLKKSIGEYKEKCYEFSMVRNYRTDSCLLEDINNCFIKISENVEKFNYDEKNQIYSLENKEVKTKIDLIKLPKEDIRAVGDFYESLLKNKKNDEYVAVLFRTNEDLKDFKRFCDMESLRCRIDVSGQFFRHQSVRDFYIMLKALTNYKQNEIIYSLVDSPYINTSINKKVIIENDTDKIHDYLDDILDREGWYKYTSLVNSMDSLSLIDKVIAEINPIKNYYEHEYFKAKRNSRDAKKTAYAKALEYKINLEYLVYLLKDKFADNVSSIEAIQSFLKNKIATDNSVDVRRLEKVIDEKGKTQIDEADFLQCSTVHKAKGLEYEYVVLPKMNNEFIVGGNVDIIIRSNLNVVTIGFKVKFGNDEYMNSYYINYKKNEKEEIIGEEARLLYVAMTRCKNRLYLNAGGVVGTEGQNNWKSLIGGAVSYV